VTGADRILCVPQEIAFCPPGDECVEGAPADWNVPDFLILDVPAKRLSTTGAVERPRATTVGRLERADGMIVLQGVENQRAYSIQIHEESGELSAAVSTPAANISIYGVCTAVPVEPPAGG
jgi:hypothetical protein